MQPERKFVDIINIDAADYRSLIDIGEQRNFFALCFGQRSFTSTQQNIRLNTNGTKLLNRMLRGFCFQFACRRDIRHQGQMHKDGVFAAAIATNLPDGFQER